MSANAHLGRDADSRPLTYDEARQVLEHGDGTAQRALAEHDETAPEILYYLAENAGTDIKTLVAANPSTPIQADSLLAADPEEDVRAELARKIGRLLPHLSAGQKTQLREQAIAILEALAADRVTRVRALLAEAIKQDERLPHGLVRRLAEDPELRVCGPILEYSTLLSDADLKEIIAASQVKGALDAIARRPALSADVSDALSQTGDVPAIAALLANPNAQIREETLDALIDGAPTVKEWHEPMVLRANLSIRAMRRIAGFVAAALVDRMVQVQALEPDQAHGLLMSVRHRIDSEQVGEEDAEAIEADANALVLQGRFHDRWVQDALVRGGQNSLIIAGLGVASGLGVRSAKQIIASRTGRAIAALCWKAGLGARIAYEVQQKLGHVAPAQLITPKGGRDYPLTASQMDWLLETFEG